MQRDFKSVFNSNQFLMNKVFIILFMLSLLLGVATQMDVKTNTLVQHSGVRLPFKAKRYAYYNNNIYFLANRKYHKIDIVNIHAAAVYLSACWYRFSKHICYSVTNTLHSIYQNQ